MYHYRKCVLITKLYIKFAFVSAIHKSNHWNTFNVFVRALFFVLHDMAHKKIIRSFSKRFHFLLRMCSVNVYHVHNKKRSVVREWNCEMTLHLNTFFFWRQIPSQYANIKSYNEWWWMMEFVVIFFSLTS